jgi:large subunit ribosomal protein L31
MAQKVKYTYNTQAKVKCSNCGSTYTLGMTIDNIQLEICGNCHPFYTGQETLVDTAGRIEKFQARMSKVSGQGKSTKLKVRKGKQSLADLSE